MRPRCRLSSPASKSKRTYLAGHPEYVFDLMEFMLAGFMLDDSRMTYSLFIEGYSTNGDLDYAPYDNDARISHARGWGTGPTSALTFYSADLRVESGAGKAWSIWPRLGGLEDVEALFETPLGRSSAEWRQCSCGGASRSFQTPEGTSWTVVHLDCVTLKGPDGSRLKVSQHTLMFQETAIR